MPYTHQHRIPKQKKRLTQMASHHSECQLSHNPLLFWPLCLPLPRTKLFRHVHGKHASAGRKDQCIVWRICILDSHSPWHYCVFEADAWHNRRHSKTSGKTAFKKNFIHFKDVSTHFIAIGAFIGPIPSVRLLMCFQILKSPIAFDALNAIFVDMLKMSVKNEYFLTT
jgi:hypothetical protein